MTPTQMERDDQNYEDSQTSYSSQSAGLKSPLSRQRYDYKSAGGIEEDAYDGQRAEFEDYYYSPRFAERVEPVTVRELNSSVQRSKLIRSMDFSVLGVAQPKEPTRPESRVSAYEEHASSKKRGHHRRSKGTREQGEERRVSSGLVAGGIRLPTPRHPRPPE